MQIAIDNAKRTFDIDVNDEIKRIKNELQVKERNYPIFMGKILENNARKRNGGKKKEGYKVPVNYSLECPMNYLHSIKFNKFRSPESTLEMSEFFVKYKLDNHRRKSKAVEELIEKYSLDLYSLNVSDSEEYLLALNDFEDLIEDIKAVYISNNYLGLMSWLLDRAFCITNDVKKNQAIINSKTQKNKVLLVKVLYTINKEAFLKCFAKNVDRKLDT